MSIVYVDSFTDELPVTLERAYENSINQWMRELLEDAICQVCEEPVFRKKIFLWWRCGDRDIILCSDCAEHTLNGLNRDLAELKGDKEAIKQPGDRYSPVLLKEEVNRLQKQITKYLKRIVDFQNLLARPD